MQGRCRHWGCLSCAHQQTATVSEAVTAVAGVVLCCSCVHARRRVAAATCCLVPPPAARYPRILLRRRSIIQRQLWCQRPGRPCTGAVHAGACGHVQGEGSCSLSAVPCRARMLGRSFTAFGPGVSSSVACPPGLVFSQQDHPCFIHSLHRPSRLQAGQAWVNAHSVAEPAGVIRGQIQWE